MATTIRLLFLLLLCLFLPQSLHAQEEVYPPETLHAMEYRLLGPHRGGRVTAVAGHQADPFTFYFGSTGGGIWKTTNAGWDWENISDGFIPVGSIGAVSVAPSDPNVIYVGTGSACMRGNVSAGRGVYKSTDAGKTWTDLGLHDAGQIGRIHVHPADPDLVYLAVAGHAFGPNPERGVFRSENGGTTWDKVLFVSDSTGAIDLAMNPHNPRELYAAMWRGERKPWTMISGGYEGGVFKSTDGGDTWKQLEGGLPTGLVGKIGVTVSPANPERVWAVVEAPGDKHGVYRSDDAGTTWRLQSTDPAVLGRPWYYHHIYADPKDEDTVWIAGGSFWKSIDGGKTFSRLAVPHSDHHDMWINPENPDLFVQGNDGGAMVTLDGGASWSSQLNQPTAELYSLTVDNQFPYRVYAPQQDNSTISLPSQATGSGVTLQHWLGIGGCETGPIAVRADNPNIVYSGCFGGRLARYDRSTEQFRQIRPYPENQGGMPESDLRYRIQWNAPITLSPHDPNTLYHGSQYVHRSYNEGQSWEVISPDLTHRDTTKFGMAGGPITHDITGVETYSSLLVIEESTHEPGVIWTGSNDGRIHITRNSGQTWTDITPPAMQNPSTVNRIHLSAHQAGKAYVAVYRYLLDDFRPYIYKTEDYGAIWSMPTAGLPEDYPVRVVREDPVREGLLFAGTEFGLFVSFDGGAQWQPFQQNLPVSPVTDMRFQGGDLIVATQGRSVWIMDDLAPLRQISFAATSETAHLFAPAPVYRSGATQSAGHYDRDRVYGAMLRASWKGSNPPAGAMLRYHLGEIAETEEVKLEILEGNGSLVRTFSSEDKTPLPSAAGLNQFVWDLRYEAPVLMRGNARGARAVPGTYIARLTIGDWMQEQSFEVRKDPRLVYIQQADLISQFEFLQEANGILEGMHEALKRLRNVRGQLGDLSERSEEAAVKKDIESLIDRLTTIEDQIIQTKPGRWANQPRLHGHLMWVITAASSQRGVPYDARPTDQLVERYEDLRLEWMEANAALERVFEEEVERLNSQLRQVEALPAQE